MRQITDKNGRSWSAERVGRTSGIISRDKSAGSFVAPADILRFECKDDANEPAREVTARAGILEQLSDEDLLTLMMSAPRVGG